MHLNPPFLFRSRSIWFVIVQIYCLSAHVGTQAAPITDATSLEAVFHSLELKLLQSPLGRPALITSNESGDTLSGDVFAAVDWPFAELRTAVTDPTRWCEISLLLSNTKGCRVLTTGQVNSIEVFTSSSKSANSSSATPSTFKFSAMNSDASALEVQLLSKNGPMGTSSILLQLRAIPLSPTGSFLQIRYSYKTSWLGRTAMQTYLQTIGRNKVGFTMVESTGAQAKPVDGARGVIERNTMRYFLGMECALKTKGPESAARFLAMADCWYEAIEKYPTQLHEMPRDEYITMKSAQYAGPQARH